MSSNRDRQSILEAFNVAALKTTKSWTDEQLDQALLRLRNELQTENKLEILDFYRSPLKEKWSQEHQVKTEEGPVTVIVPRAEDEDDEEAHFGESADRAPDARQSLQIQAKLAEIGAIMGYKIWTPRSDRARIRNLVIERYQISLLDDLPLNYDDITLNTIEQIDILWLRGRSIARAFEVEHTTAVYSGLLRMADLLALQPNMDIRLHIVAPDERRDKVFREMMRPVFSLLDRGPLSRSCTFLSYESVESIRDVEHLAYTNDGIITAYEEVAPS